MIAWLVKDILASREHNVQRTISENHTMIEEDGSYVECCNAIGSVYQNHEPKRMNAVCFASRYNTTQSISSLDHETALNGYQSGLLMLFVGCRVNGEANVRLNHVCTGRATGRSYIAGGGSDT
jgi:hypothetical protein